MTRAPSPFHRAPILLMLAATLVASGYRVVEKAKHHHSPGDHRIIALTAGEGAARRPRAAEAFKAAAGGGRGPAPAMVAQAALPVARQPHARPPLKLLAPAARPDGPDACCGVPRRRRWIVSGGHGRHGAG